MAPIDGAGDNSHWADTRLMVVRLRRLATEGTTVRTSNDLRVEGELGPTLPCRPSQPLAIPEFLYAAGAVRRLHPQHVRMRRAANREVLLDAPLRE